MIGPAITQLRPIGLGELTARAALMARVDRKYMLPPAELPELLAVVADGARVLDIDGRRDFGYRSVYFDTPRLDSFLATARRRRRRFKVRVRSYLDTGTRYVEVKTRGPRGSTVKRRVPCVDESRLGDGADLLLVEAGVPATSDRFEPALTTTYRRSTLFLPATGGRVTVDTDLTWTVPGGGRLETPGRVIVETKSPGAASAVDRLLWSLGHRPCAVSKYGTGLAALRPELPANRWHPVLRRHFPNDEERRP